MKKAAAGFTIVELVVVMTVISIIMLVITGYTMTNLQESTYAAKRQDILQQIQLSLDLAANDVRLSANADANNRWADDNSPSGSANQYDWESNASVLILATAAQDADGNIIFADPNSYITEKNNQIYFLKDGTLYKRFLAADVAGNTAKTSCPAASASSDCPADKELLRNVQLFQVKYLNGQNQEVVPTDARSVELRVIASDSIYNKEISVDYSTRMVFRND